MIQRVILILAACIVAFSLNGCKLLNSKESESTYEKVYNKLSSMESYASENEISIIGNKSTSTYTVRQFCKKTGEYRVETLSPDTAAGSVTTFDGTAINHYNPRIDGKISVSESGSTDNVLTLLTTFMKNYESSNEVSVYAGSFNDGGEIILEARIPGEHMYFSSEKLWVDSKTLYPAKLIVYDIDGSERIIVTYKRFEYNVKLEDRIFK